VPYSRNLAEEVAVTDIMPLCHSYLTMPVRGNRIKQTGDREAQFDAFVNDLKIVGEQMNDLRRAS
jgi:hypothetical protein